MSEKKTLAELCADLDKQTELLRDAEKGEEAARTRVTSHRNAVNAIQKAIDAEMAARRKTAPWSTDWHSQQNPGRAVG
jgi:hypothetical protein